MSWASRSVRHLLHSTEFAACGAFCCVTAIACLLGMPSFRANLENLPLNHDLMILLLGFHLSVSAVRLSTGCYNDVAGAV